MSMKRGIIVLLLAVLAAALCMGCALASTVSGIVWVDRSADGIYQPKEALLDDVRVSLRDEDEREIAVMDTGRDGQFVFPNVDDGTYYLEMKLPKDYAFTVHGADSAALPAVGELGRTALFTLSGDMNLMIGATKSSSYINLYAFEDENANGGRFSTEPFIDGVEVQLLYDLPNGGTLLVDERTTNRDGYATFRDMTPGTYRLSVTLPGMYVIGPLGLKISTFYNCVPPTDSNSGVTEPFEVTPNNSIGLAVGAVKTGAASGSIWYDKNFDGARGKGEGGFEGAKVTLESPSMDITRTMLTDASGDYAFKNLQPGAYRLTVTLPEGTMFTHSGSLMTSGASEESTTLSVTVERETRLADIGVMPATSLSVTFFLDKNADGIQDASDSAFAGAKVEVLRDGKVIATALSDSVGLASIPVLRGGDAEVRCSLPDGQVFTVRGAEGGNVFVSPTAVSVCTLNTDIAHAQATNLVAGVTIAASLSGQLFEDMDQDGILGGAEGALEGFEVVAVDASGAEVARTVTDSEGKYAFANLLPAAHSVRFMLKDPYAFSNYSQTGAQTENDVISQTPDYGQTDVVVLAPGQSVAHLDGGAFKTAVITGAVRTGDKGMPGVRLTLLTEQGENVSEHTIAQTDDNGDFYLKGALPGTYRLQYDLPLDTAFVLPFTDDARYVTDAFSVIIGDEKEMSTVETVYTATLAGTVFFDTDGTGTRGADEDAVTGASLTLVSEAGYAYQANTDAAGAYLLSGVRPESYTLTLSLPEGMVTGFSETSPVPALAQNESIAELSFQPGQKTMGADISVQNEAAFSLSMYYDMNNNGAYDAGEAAVAGMEARLYDARSGEIITLMTDANGRCEASPLIPGEYSLRVTLDADCVPAGAPDAVFTEGEWRVPVTVVNEYTVSESTLGVLRYASLSGNFYSVDGTMNGVAGLSVKLARVGVQKAMTTVTDEQGAYMFDGLVPGNYKLSVMLPDGFSYARTVDTALRDSHIFTDKGLVYSDVAQLSMGEKLGSYDVGIGALGKLGDFAWLDENGNGLQDGDEPGVPGIKVQLWQYGELAAETTTDVYGRYLLDGIFPGTYELTVTMYSELKTTKVNDEFPLVNSILPANEKNTATVQGVVVPSGKMELSCDLGFALVKKGAYPDAMENIPTVDWSPINNRED